MTSILFAAVVAAFTNDLSVLSIDDAGRLTSVRERASGRQLISSRTPMIRIEFDDGSSAESAGVSRLADGRFEAELSGGGKPAGKAVFSVAATPWGWTFVLDAVNSERRVRSAELWRIKAAPRRYVGSFANVSSDDRSFVALRAYTPAMSASATPVMCVKALAENSVTGHVAALSAGPREKAVECLRAMTIASGAPRSLCGGAWSLGAAANRDSYLFASRPRAAHVDDWIAAARRGGMAIVHFYSWFASRGQYEPDGAIIPGGIDGMKQMVGKIHEAGFKAGMHTFTGRIGFEDAFVRPHCSSNLIVFGSYTLAAPLSAGAEGEMLVAERPADGHDLCASIHGRGNYLLVDGEIVQYSGVRRESPYAFTGIVRGACGTRRKSHAAGARVDYLRSRYQGFYPVIGSPLADKVAANIARAWNECGFDMIYLDGSEAHGTRHDVDSMRRLVVSKLDQSPSRPILNEASCSYPGSWWFHSRNGAMDYPYWADKHFHDFHIAHTVASARKANFMEPQLGWWSFRAGKSKHIRHEFQDEMEYFAAKAAGAGASVSLLSLDANTNRLGYVNAQGLTILGWHEYPKMAEAFSADALEWLRKPGFETRLRQGTDGKWRLRETTLKLQRASGQEEAGWRVDSPARRPAALRVEALYEAGKEEDGKTLLSACDIPSMKVSSASGVKAGCSAAADPAHGAGIRLSAENVSAKDRRAAWVAATLEFKYPWFGISGLRAMSLWVKGDGSGALLGVQVHAPAMHSGAFSDHFVRLDFKGWRRVNFLLRERETELALSYKWHHTQKRKLYEMYRFIIGKQIESVSLMLNDIPAGSRAEVEVSPVAIVPEVKTVLSGAAVSINGERYALPFDLESGEHAELEDGCWVHYSEEGEPCGRKAVRAAPYLSAGSNKVGFSAAGDGMRRAEIAVFSFGAERDAFRPLTPEMRRVMRHESTMPVTYAPARGFDTFAPIAIRPGERAGIGFSCYGPMPQSAITLADRRFAIPALAEGERFDLPPDTEKPFEGLVKVSFESDSAAGAVDTRFDFVKTYKE